MSSEAQNPEYCQATAIGAALFWYRFKITSNQNNSILGTGVMTASKPLDKTEQIDLFHNWTHGKYLNSENYVSVLVSKADHEHNIYVTIKK